MSKLELKKIIVPQKLQETSWATFFSDINIELVDNSISEFDKATTCKISDCMIPDVLVLKNAQIKYLLKSYFNAIEKFNIFEELSASKQELLSFKIHDSLNGGSFIDAVTIEAYKYKNSFNHIRNFLNGIFAYADKQEFHPIEINYGNTPSGFALQVTIHSQGFELSESLINATNFVEVTELQNKTYYNISALWFNEKSLKDIHFYFKKIKFDLKNNEENITKQAFVPSLKAYTQMEQQMLRMKDLLYKMKEQLKEQKQNTSSAEFSESENPELANKVKLLILENQQLQDEKKYINARLQLANRKLQIMDSNLDKREELVRPNFELEKEIELLKKTNEELTEKLSLAVNSQDTSSLDLEIAKLNEIKLIYETKMKEQVTEIKKGESRIKIMTSQIEGLVKKLTAPATGAKTNENHAKQLEHASKRVADVTLEYNEKKKEILQVKQENSKLLGQIYELEKRIAFLEKKVA